MDPVPAAAHGVLPANHLEPPSFIQTLSSFVPSDLSTSEKVRAVVAVAFAVIIAVAVSVSAVGTAYLAFASLAWIKIGLLTGSIVLLVEAIIVIARNIFQREAYLEAFKVRLRESQVKLDSDHDKEGEFNPQGPIPDVSQLTPAQFLERVTADIKEAYAIESNCKNMSEVEAVFLGERHTVLSDKIVNTHACRFLVREGDVVFNELGQGRFAAHVFTRILPRKLTFRQWDDKPAHIEITALQQKVGLILQRWIEVHTKNAVEGDTLRKIGKSLKECIKWLRGFENDARLCNKKGFLKAIFKIKEISRESAEDAEKWKMDTRDFKIVFKTIELACFSIDELSAWSKKCWKHRQKALVRSLQQARVENNRNRLFISAGSRHFVEDNDKIDKTLNGYLASSQIKYAILYPKVSAQKDAPVLERSKAIDDFRKLPENVSCADIRELLLKKQKEALKLYGTLIQEKNPGAVVP